MKFEKITLDEIIPSPYNPRIISEDELTKLEKNIKEFGLVDPIIINLKNMHIIGGHQRYEVLRKLAGTDTDYENLTLQLIRLGNIGWVFTETDLNIQDEAHEKALNLALNKISGEWDTPKLNNILIELEDLNFDIDLTGFELDTFIFDTTKEDNTTKKEYDNNNYDSFYNENEYDDEYIEPSLEEDEQSQYNIDPPKWKKKSFYLREGEEWIFGNHKLKIGKPSFNDYYKIQIQQDDIGISFVVNDSENSFEKFIEKNKNNKGLKTKGDVFFEE